MPLNKMAEVNLFGGSTEVLIVVAPTVIKSLLPEESSSAESAPFISNAVYCTICGGAVGTVVVPALTLVMRKPEM